MLNFNFVDSNVEIKGGFVFLPVSLSDCKISELRGNRGTSDDFSLFDRWEEGVEGGSSV